MDPKKSTDPSAVSSEVSEPGHGAGLTGTVGTRDKSSAALSYDWLGPSLRRMYDEVLNEPIPDSFVDLLQQLYDRQKKHHG